MKRLFLPLATALTLTACSSTTDMPSAPAPRERDTRSLEQDIAQAVAGVAEREIAAGHIPGAVILIGTKEHNLFRGAFGNRRLGTAPTAMTADTIFDLASLTKAIATTTAVMQLVEAGRLDLNAPVARYWPKFAAHGKSGITVEQLLTHYAGLAPDLDLSVEWRGYNVAMMLLAGLKPQAAPGARYTYSDINFEVLGELVRRVSGKHLDRYCRDRIFAPLGMRDTYFLPPLSLRERIAPTEDTRGLLHWGEVHDATSRWMGGVAGHAGLFSTVDDLAVFARTLLNHGEHNGVRILQADTVETMMQAHSPAGGRERGLGWDIGGEAGNKTLAPGAVGHYGFTGTLIVIHPKAEIFAIVLTHRVYPDGTGDAGPLREAVLQLVADIVAKKAL